MPRAAEAKCGAAVPESAGLLGEAKSPQGGWLPADRIVRCATLFEGLFKIGHNLLFAAHDARQPHGRALGLDAEGFFHHSGIVRNDEHFRAFFHDVGEEQENAVAAMR